MTHVRQNHHLLALVCLFVCVSGCATEWSAKVVSVADGDTLSVLRRDQRVRIRLHGVDTPEKRQPFGRKAKRFTKQLALGHTATVRTTDHDRYGRTVAKVFVNGQELNAKLLEAGLAWHYRQYDNSPLYARLEAQARAAKRGLWSQPHPTPPWAWRRAQRKARKSKTPFSPPSCAGQPCPIHGNHRSHVYHHRGCKHFDCRHCTVGFQAPDQAHAAGYHPHRACN